MNTIEFTITIELRPGTRLVWDQETIARTIKYFARRVALQGTAGPEPEVKLRLHTKPEVIFV